MLQFEEQIGISNCIDGRVRFLVEAAPTALFAPGAEFTLVEGPKVVAIVRVLADHDSDQHVGQATQSNRPSSLDDLRDSELNKISYEFNVTTLD